MASVLSNSVPAPRSPHSWLRLWAPASCVDAYMTVATDYPDKHVLENMAHNAAALKNLPDAPALALETTGLAWGNAQHERYVAANSDALRDGAFDVVCAADVLWVSSQHAAFLHSVEALLAPAQSARFVLVAGFHTGRPAITRFLRSAHAAGLVRDASAPHGGVYERSFQGEIRPWQGASLDEPPDAAPDEDMGDVGERARWVVVAMLRR